MPVSKKDLNELREDWYGPERALDERISSNPQFHPFSDVLDNYMKGIVSEGALILGKIDAEWEDIVGPQNVRLCRPVFFRDGALKIEVNHPAYRLALDTPKMKQAISARLSRLGIDCTSIQFVPPGGFKSR